MNLVSNYGSVSDQLLDKVGDIKEDVVEDVQDTVEDATDHMEDVVDDASSTIDMTNVPNMATTTTSIGVPAEMNELVGDVSHQAKAVGNDAQSIMRVHVDSARM